MLTVRGRLTALYGGLFLVSGAGLLAVTYGLVRRATGGTSCVTGPGDAGICITGSGPPPAADLPTRQLEEQAVRQHAHELHQLLIQSGIALGLMTAVAVLLGWLVAGRVLRPLRAITEATRDISATSLDRRLALAGPDDELRALGATIDDLLARLEAAFTAQRRFVANASHELRTPLTLVRALLQMALADPDATVATVRRACQEALAENDQQERLIEALLALARGERGLDRRAPLDLAAVVEEVLMTPRPGPELRVRLGPAPADGDVRLVERLVANLVDNAVRHNVPGGLVEVATGDRAGRPYLVVANTGPVIPADEVPRLFEPFRRLARDAGGFGLGLSIVQAVATAHGATVIATPRPGGGLRVEVAFPPSLPSSAVAVAR